MSADYGKAGLHTMVLLWKERMDPDPTPLERELMAQEVVGKPVTVDGRQVGTVASARATEDGVEALLEFDRCPWLYD